MIETFANRIGGARVSAASGRTFDDEDPAHRGSILAKFAASDCGDMRAAVDAAAAAREPWTRTPLEARQKIAAKGLALLEARGEELAGIVSRENGKTIREARAEVGSALLEGRYHVNQASAFQGETGAPGPAGAECWVRYEPVGVVGIISPWNFPLNVMCRKAVPALLMGNPVVFKPASFTPWSGVFMAELFQEAGCPPGVFNCITGEGSAVGNALVDDERVRAISFTGSTPVGRSIHERAARRFARTQMELGGKNAAIVCEDADLDVAAAAVMTAGFACAGQWCTSTSRVLVQRRICEDFTARLTRRCEALVVGDPLDEKTDMGPVAGPKQYEGILEAIRKGVAEGARLVTGGAAEGALGAQGYFIRPTLLSGVAPGSFVFREEIFGPVLGVTAFDTFEDALRLANDSEFALSSAIFTRDIARAHRYIREIQAGLAHVNIHTGFKLPSMPFGGWKNSGCGLPENSRTGLEFFVERKAVYVAS